MTELLVQQFLTGAESDIKYMSIERKYFGTDGIRGCVGEMPIRPDFMLRFGFVFGSMIMQDQTTPANVLIGRDSRISGGMLEAALTAGLTAAGVNVGSLGILPTPGIAYLTRMMNAQAGIVISASHNPYKDNGIKIFTSQGTKLPDEIELEIEQQLEKRELTITTQRLGKVFSVSDAADQYISYCQSIFPSGSSLDGLKVVLDCAHGANYQVAPVIFSELGADVLLMGDEPDGFNINENCGATHIDALCKKMLAEQADVGIAFDGDGDRAILVDSRGRIIDGDDMLYIMAQYLTHKNRLIGGIVGTAMTNFGLEIAFKKMDIEFVRAQVGDRYVLKELIERNWMLGGETSGHVICLDVATSGDGIISALQVLAAMIFFDKSLDELTQGFQKLPQILLNVCTQERIDLEGSHDIQMAVKNANAQLNGKGRVLLRLSGTEPLVRVMVEGENLKQIQAIAKELADVVKTTCHA